MRRLLFLVFATILFQAVFGQKQKLRFNLVIGQTYYLKMKSSMSFEMGNTHGQKANFDLTDSSKMAFKVIDLKDTIYDINVSYQKLAMLMKPPFGDDIRSNSDEKDENDISSNVLKAVIDKPFLIKMTTLGKIVEVKNIDSIFRQALDKFPKLSEVQRLLIKEHSMQAFGERAFKSDFEMGTAIYCNDSVDKGDCWAIKRNLESNEILTTTYQFKDKDENYAFIVGNGNIELSNKDTDTQINGMPIKSNLAGTINSNLQVDSRTGWIVEGKINESTSGNQEVKDNPKLPGGVKQTISISAEITYSSK